MADRDGTDGRGAPAASAETIEVAWVPAARVPPGQGDGRVTVAAASGSGDDLIAGLAGRRC